MNWIPLTESAQLDDAVILSYTKPVAIYKHSTRCSVSVMVKKGLERDWNIPESEIPAYYLDLIAYRSLSDSIAEIFDVRHESPQLILIKDGNAIYHASHSEIDIDAMLISK